MRDAIARYRLSVPIFNALLIAGAFFLGKEVLKGGAMLRVYAALGIMALLALPAIRRPQAALLGLFAWLPFLGMVRRIFISNSGVAPLDPLLLISTAVTILLFIMLMISRRADMSGTPLMKLVFFFLVVATIELLNPLQGNYLVALTGVMFVITPMMMFIIARTIADEQYMRKVQTIVMVTGVFCALWGLKQVYFGFTGFEQTWLQCCGYGALRIDQTTRPFSTFSNAVEFSTYMGFAIVTCYSRLLYAKGNARIVFLGAAGVMAYAGFLVGSRGFVIGTLLAIVILTGLRVRNRLFGIMVVLSMVAAAVGWSAVQTSDVRIQDVKPGKEQLVNQQFGALKDPTDTSKSTLPAHMLHIWAGLDTALKKRPVGLGTGAITRGGAKFGTGTSSSTELDMGNSFVAFGLVGGFLYLALVLMAFRQLYLLRRLTGNAMWVAVLGMCILSIGQWQNGGAYAISSLLWFSLGASDRAFMEVRNKPLENEALPEAA